VALHEDYVALFVEEGADLEREIRGEKENVLKDLIMFILYSGGR
jgi:hypothetical protein